MITAERKRQITREGWSLEHDQDHVANELVQAAYCYILASRVPA